MNTQVAEGSLKDLKGSLKQTWSKLTDDDLNYIDGGVDQIIGKVQKAYGFTKERAEEEFNKFKSQNSKLFREGRNLANNTMERTMTTASQLNGQYDAKKIQHKASNMIEGNIVEPGAEYLERAREYGSQLVDRTAGIVKENPAYAILGAATVGFLAGAYFFRRK
ncbi:MAG: CsbD family protein [Bacteriovorax sp.]|nr:CsbD family protein [Bacteriovorax sp.]